MKHLVWLDLHLTNDIVDVGVGGQVHFNYIPQNSFFDAGSSAKQGDQKFQRSNHHVGGKIQTTLITFNDKQNMMHVIGYY